MSFFGVVRISRLISILTSAVLVSCGYVVVFAKFKLKPPINIVQYHVNPSKTVNTEYCGEAEAAWNLLWGLMFMGS